MKANKQNKHLCICEFLYNAQHLCARVYVYSQQYLGDLTGIVNDSCLNKDCEAQIYDEDRPLKGNTSANQELRSMNVLPSVRSLIRYIARDADTE